MVDINVRNKKNWKGKGFYVGRPHPLSNPFKIKYNQTREECIDKYGRLILSFIKSNNSSIINPLKNLESYLIKNGEINLICHCSPLPCHADIIKQILLNKFYTNKWLISEKNFDKIGIYNL